MSAYYEHEDFLREHRELEYLRTVGDLDVALRRGQKGEKLARLSKRGRVRWNKVRAVRRR